MASLPVISGNEAVKVFEQFGWTVASICQPVEEVIRECQLN